MSDQPRLLEVNGLSVIYPDARRGLLARQHNAFRAVDDVTFSLAPGETLALVGESGSGKSTIGNAILGLAPVSRGSVTFMGNDISHLSAAGRREHASEIQVVFQDPYGSLNPALRIGDILTEPLRVRMKMSRKESANVIADLLERVGMPADSASRYPGHFSGGQRQRIAIARALAVKPKLIICDEPTSGLDVSTQKVVLDLLQELKANTNVAYLFITHDLAVVRHFADRVAVLRQGQLVEVGSPADVCERPTHTYTQRLVAAAPVPEPGIQRTRREARLALAVSQTDLQMKGNS